jgi:hypothetical protein
MSVQDSATTPDSKVPTVLAEVVDGVITAPEIAYAYGRSGDGSIAVRVTTTCDSSGTLA